MFWLAKNFLTEIESKILLKEVDRKLKRICKNYLDNHFDGVITGYKEAISSDFNEDCQLIFKKIKEETMRVTNRQLKFTDPHILDLREHNSGIKRHVDSQTFGNVIAGVCLISPCVMIFRPKDSDKEFSRVLLPPLSFYCQWDDMRQNYSHEIPMTDDPNHSIDGQFVERKRRVSIMFRDQFNPTQN